MRENRQSGSEGGGTEINRSSLPLFTRLGADPGAEEGSGTPKIGAPAPVSAPGRALGSHRCVALSSPQVAISVRMYPIRHKAGSGISTKALNRRGRMPRNPRQEVGPRVPTRREQRDVQPLNSRKYRFGLVGWHRGGHPGRGFRGIRAAKSATRCRSERSSAEQWPDCAATINSRKNFFCALSTRTSLVRLRPRRV